MFPAKIDQFVRFESLGDLQSLGDLEQSDPWWRPNLEALVCRWQWGAFLVSLVL